MCVLSSFFVGESAARCFQHLGRFPYCIAIAHLNQAIPMKYLQNSDRNAETLGPRGFQLFFIFADIILT